MLLGFLDASLMKPCFLGEYAGTGRQACLRDMCLSDVWVRVPLLAYIISNDICLIKLINFKIKGWIIWNLVK